MLGSKVSFGLLLDSGGIMSADAVIGTSTTFTSRKQQNDLSGYIHTMIPTTYPLCPIPIPPTPRVRLPEKGERN
jgi:hypothetical protein